MDARPTDFKRLFTVDEANAMLPLVRAICTDLARLSRDVIDRRERLAVLLAGRDKSRSDVYSEELAQIESELQTDSRTLQEYLEELKDLGVEPKNGLEGLVDFPAVMDDRVVYLCWKLNEPEVQYWHELDTGYSGRQPLMVDTAGGDDGDRAGGAPLGGSLN